MSESTTNKNEMGNIVSGSKDLLSSSLHRSEGNKEEETGQVVPIETEQSDSSSTEPEIVPEQSSTSDKQQPSTGDKKDTESTTNTPKLQHDGSTESKSDGSGGGGGGGTESKISFNDLFLKLLLSRGFNSNNNDSNKEKDDVILDEDTHNSFPDENDFSILDMLILERYTEPESFRFKNRYHKNKKKKKNKRKRWYKSKKQRKPNGKIHYIIF